MRVRGRVIKITGSDRRNDREYRVALPPIRQSKWYERRDLNPHVQWTLGPKPSASANSATLARLKSIVRICFDFIFVDLVTLKRVLYH